MKHTKLTLIALATMLLPSLATAQEAFTGWKHAGALAILTTPDGANLPTGAVIEGFPVLVKGSDSKGVGQRKEEYVTI